MKRKSSLLLIPLLLANTAHAAFYVDEDVPQQVVVNQRVISENPKPTTLPTYTYNVPFFNSHYTLGKKGQKTLSNILTELKKTEGITIQGRPDPSNLDNTDVARRRANTIKRWLVANGIKASKISVEIVREAKYTDMANVYASTIITAEAEVETVTPPPNTLYVRRISASTHTDYGYHNNQAESNAVPMSAIQRILNLVTSKQLSAEEAIKLLEIQLGNKVTTSPSTIKPVILPAKNSVTIAYHQEPDTWILNEKDTLKKNLEDWVRAAKWNNLQWRATQQYRIGKTVTINGAFPDVLRQVTDSTGLNVCAKRLEKVITVTDANVPCK